MPRDKRPNVVILAPGSAAGSGGGGGLPAAHASTHQNGGGDEINLTGLSGVLADPQPPIIGAGATQAVAGTDTRLTDARTPTAHAASHKSGGSDAIKLDELSAPTDIATLNASTTVHGLLKKLSNVSTEFLNGQGNWATPPSGGGWTVISNAATGATNDWAPAGLSGNTIIEWNGASDAAFTGLAGGSAGQIVTVKNITAAKIATFAHLVTSSAGNQFSNYATSAPTPIFTRGFITFQHDGTNWKILDHQQGAWISVTYAGTDFTASAGTWTVDSGDVQMFKYKLDGPTLLVAWALGTTSVSTTPGTLFIKIPGGFSADAVAARSGPHFYKDNGGAYIFGEVWSSPASLTSISLFPAGFGSGSPWSASTNNTATYGTALIEVS